MSSPFVTPYTFLSAPAIPTVANFNTHTTDLTALLNPEELIATSPYSGTTYTAQAVATSAWTAVNLSDTAPGCQDALAILTANVVTIQWGGTYELSYALNWATATAGRRTSEILHISGGNKTRLLVEDNIFGVVGPTTYEDGTTAKATDSLVVSDIVHLSAGDTLELYVWQSSGASINLGTTAIAGARLALSLINTN